jgi:putative ABC transport system permease protein
VGGVLKMENGFEDGGVFLPLSEAQAFFHRPDTYSVVAIKLRDPATGPDFKRAVENALPRLTAVQDREFNQSYNSFRILRATSWAVGACAFLLGGLGVANTMLMSVFGRIREIAILRVCGFSQAQITALVFGEALAVALVGLAAGGLLSALLLGTLPHVSQLQGYVQASVGPHMLLSVAALALLTAVLGAIYPARFAGRIQPAEALRYE